MTVTSGGQTSNGRMVLISGSACPLQLVDILGNGAPGDILVLEGSGFDVVRPEDNVVSFQKQGGTTTAPVLGSGATRLQVRIPDDAVNGTVTVSVGGSTSNALQYNRPSGVP